MEHEHRIERGLIGDLHEATASYREGDASAANRFVESARAYLRLLVGHIEKEDSILFRLGDEILDEQDKAVLAENFKQFDSELVGRTPQDFDRIASELEEKWAV
jgi:hemerythrin-like domain-containing protein